jgi:hypothetical protein
MSNVTLRSEDLHWMDRAIDNPSDQCVHGEVELAVDETVFVTPSGGDWNLTAAGLFLLRTLTDNSSSSHSVCEDNFLIPCCGFNPWVVEGGRYPLLIQGCNRGINIFVEHQTGAVRLTSSDGKEAVTTSDQWCTAVLRFTAEIEAWYAQNPPRTAPEDEHDAQGWQALWQEWKSRRKAVLHAA